MAVQFGFPEFRQQFHEKFRPVLRALSGIECALNGIVDSGYEGIDGWQCAVLNLGRLNGVAMEELVILASNGCGHGAMKILRSMLETTVDTEFLRLNPGRFSEYLDWSHFERWKLYGSLRRIAQRAYEQLGEEEIVRAKGEYDRVLPVFRQGGRDRSRWCGTNLREEAKQAGLEALYELFNPLASKLLHGGMFGLLLYFDPKSDIHRIQPPPDMKWCQQALVGGHECLLQTIRTLSQALQRAPEPSIITLEAEKTAAWRAVAEG